MLEKMVEYFLEFGGRIFVCIPCIESRKITPDLPVDKAQLVKAGKVVPEVLEAKAVLNY